MPRKKENGQNFKMTWAVKHCFEAGFARPESVQKLIEQFGISYNYARTIIYNHLCYLDWPKAPYPENRKSRKRSKKIKEALKEKFQINDSGESYSDLTGDIPADFDF